MSIMAATCRPGSMPQLLVNDWPGSQLDQVLAAAERVRRTRHRLDGEAAPAHVRKRVPREHHHVRMRLVDPERDAPSPGLGVRSSTRARPSSPRSRSVKAWSSTVAPIARGRRKS